MQHLAALKKEREVLQQQQKDITSRLLQIRQWLDCAKEVKRRKIRLRLVCAKKQDRDDID